VQVTLLLKPGVTVEVSTPAQANDAARDGDLRGAEAGTAGQVFPATLGQINQALRSIAQRKTGDSFRAARIPWGCDYLSGGMYRDTLKPLGRDQEEPGVSAR
jgi:hypothetical protein